MDKKTLKQKLHQALQNWFYNPDAFHKQAESKLTDPRNIEPGFIDKLNEMFKYRGILQDLKQDYEQKNGISPGYCRTEGKYVVEQMLNFDSLYMHNIFSTRSENLDAEWQKMVNKARFENYVVAYKALRLQCESEYDRFMKVYLRMKKYFLPVCQMKTSNSRFLSSKTSTWAVQRQHPKNFTHKNSLHNMGVKRIHYQQLLQRKQNFQHHLQLILIQKNTITRNKRNSQAFANKKVSLIKEAQLTPKDQPSNLEVELIHTLLMLAQ